MNREKFDFNKEEATQLLTNNLPGFTHITDLPGNPGSCLKSLIKGYENDTSNEYVNYFRIIIKRDSDGKYFTGDYARDAMVTGSFKRNRLGMTETFRTERIVVTYE